MYVSPKDACKHYKVTSQTLRVWANEGKIQYITTDGGHRRYRVPSGEGSFRELRYRYKYIYTRVSNASQKDDLLHQTKILKAKYPDHLVISDIGSGIDFHRRGLLTLLDIVFSGTCEEVVMTQKDRLTQFGYELFEWIFARHHTRLACDATETDADKQEMSDDIISLLAVFTARYHGLPPPLENLRHSEVLALEDELNNPVLFS